MTGNSPGVVVNPGLRTSHEKKALFPNRKGILLGPFVLLRKEVIQPHVPVRLPCYDFTPIINPAFGSSLPCGLGH